MLSIAGLYGENLALRYAWRIDVALSMGSLRLTYVVTWQAQVDLSHIYYLGCTCLSLYSSKAPHQPAGPRSQAWGIMTHSLVPGPSGFCNTNG